MERLGRYYNCKKITKKSRTLRKVRIDLRGVNAEKNSLTYLNNACRASDSSRVKFLLVAGILPNDDPMPNSLLVIVCGRHLNLLMVKILLNHGIDVNNNGWTPLHEACASGSSMIVGILLEMGANVEAKAYDETPYDVATEYVKHVHSNKLFKQK